MGTMKIILSPAKKMQVQNQDISWDRLPPLLPRTEILRECLKNMEQEPLQRLLACNENIARLNYQRFRNMDLKNNLTPALLAYEGIQYQYMAPQVFSEQQWAYAKKHVNILSGFYGILNAGDGVVPYRLEMQAKLAVGGKRDLYQFWGDLIHEELSRDAEVILNLASKEYSRSVEPYRKPGIKYVTCIFGELIDGRVRMKGTHAKMARGEMVRWLAEEGVVEPEGIRGFQGLGYRYAERYSTESELVFLKQHFWNGV